MTKTRDPRSDVAIIGMSCIYPGAGDLEAFRRNIAGGVDAVTEVPHGRWEPEFYDSDSSSVDRLYCKRGGFIDEFAQFDALRWGVMPVAADAAEPDQLLALEVSARALADAGYEEREFPRESTGVILGRGGYLSRGMARFASTVRNSEEMVQCLRRLVPGVSEAELAAVRREFHAGLGHHGPDTVIGIVPNLAASRVANRLDLRGPSYTIDAACASSLIAVDRACADLLTGKSDLALAGGVHLVHDVSFWSVFCQMGAMSRNQQIRPFDRRADGILIGEGIGIVVLKRLEDARRDGDRVYAVVRGTGVSSDGRATSLMTPSTEGQELALRRAWKMAGLDPGRPGSIGLIEAHGTATPVGDLAELSMLEEFFRGAAPPDGIALGSIKSMIGHAMPAAGAAGLIKAALAIHDGVLPPTLHCEEPHEALASSGFRPVREAEPWEANGAARRAGVNAFGFGGINAHVILEQDREASGTMVSVPAMLPPVLLGAAASANDLARALEEGRAAPGDGPCRVAVVDPTSERIERAAGIVRRGRPFHGRKGIWFTPEGLITRGGKIAFLFPGVDADFQPRADDVARFFGGDALPDTAVLAGATELERTGVGIVMVNQLLQRTLEELGVKPDFLCGHSIGEWSAMIAAGVLADDDVRSFMHQLEPASLNVPGLVFAAIGCGRDRALEALVGLEDVVVSHDNCPHQVILCGREASVDAALARLRTEGVLCQKLKFQSGFHTPLFRDFVAPLRRNIDDLPVAPPRVPLWSATTCRAYPAEPEAIRKLFVEHLLHPVRFRELIRTLHEAGARAFIQVGTGSLVGFVDDCLQGTEHVTLGANTPRRSGMDQLRRVLAALWVEGAEVDHERIFSSYEPTPTSDRSMLLHLGAPLVRLGDGVRLSAAAPAGSAGERLAASGAGADPVVAEFASMLDTLERSGREVLEAWEAPQHAPAPTGQTHTVVRRRLDFESTPHLLHHCFFAQPEGWPHPGDGFPVVPMTMSLSMMIEAVRGIAGDRVVIGLEDVRAHFWIAVEEPLEITIDARFVADDRVHVRIDHYIDADVLLAAEYPAAPEADGSPLEGERPVPFDAASMYADRWMFHGPAYQGVVDLTGVGERGIRGVLEELPAEGALLDCAGQLFGLWIMLKADRDRMAMPVRLNRVTLYGPDPDPGTRFDCRVRIDHFGTSRVRSDIDVSTGGRVWCRMQGWEDRRFETNDRLWSVMIFPETHLLSAPHGAIPGCCVMRESLERSTTRDYFARRYLDGPEVGRYRAMNPKQQTEWLPNRIAAKDAVRNWLWNKGHGPVFPIEVEIDAEESGRPRVRSEHAPDLRISIAGKPGVSAAIVAQGREVGIDVERIEPRDRSFEDLAFTPTERAMLPGEERDEWVARFWAAKEAAAKARGTGLEGNPKSVTISERDGTRLRADGRWISTAREGDLVFAWWIEEP